MNSWEIHAVQFGNCNCDYNCPCQFGMPNPTHGHCHGYGAGEIESGHYSDVDLAGCRFVLMYSWPGPIHEGNGECQFVIDATSDDQRAALGAILSGGDTEPFATHFAVFATTMATHHPSLYSQIEFDLDIAARTARVHIDGLVEGRGEPMRDAVSGEPSRVRLDLPEGFEYEIAEIGSGSSTVTSAIEMRLDESYAQFSELHLNQSGVIRGATAKT